jgi:hypothetical protein
VLLAAGLLLGAFTLLVAAAPALWLAAILMIPLGAVSMSFLATINSTLQLASSDEMRGRVMALYFVLFLEPLRLVPPYWAGSPRHSRREPR